jgi:3-oxoacyl-[acyl-carrier-protein] synthase-3
MAILTFENVGIKAIAACVPKNISSNYDLGYLIPKDEIEKTINSIGIEEKRFVDNDTCSSDLCVKAAQKLFEDNNIDPNSIDLLLFLSQTPDYKIPATSPRIQHRLGLPKSTACLDLSLGCSGYVYALSTAFAYASMEGVNRVLLLVGETFSKIVNPMDKVNAPLYGDAGTATLVEKGEFGKSHFSLYSDGEGFHAVKITAGQCRVPATPENLQETEMEGGNIRSKNQVFMDGMNVFNFALKVVPNAIKEIAAKSGNDLEKVDYIVFHQANKFMTDFFVKKLKYKSERVPYCINKFGNTSSASIPLTISSELHDERISDKNVIMCGFGAGLSWGAVYYTFDNCNISPVIEY